MFKSGHQKPNTCVVQRLLLFCGTCCLLAVCLRAEDYQVCDSHGIGRRFDGIGAISGGGATSKLLPNYPSKQKNEILDLLFKPSYGASLQLLKVEIGGDSQSSEGAESSHMHSENDINYYRGYEWWLMKEAKKRNPVIRLYGLPWTFPGYLSAEGQNNPYHNRTKLVQYFLNWVTGAKFHHQLDIDYLGIWNERPYDIEFIWMLKESLNRSGFGHVKLVAGDAQSWQIVQDYRNSSLLRQSLDIVGYHYPGASSPAEAQALPIPLWASEEYSSTNEISGGGCWARVLGESYPRGLFTGFIAWNLIASYYDDLPYPRMGLMTANEPWSGFYDISSPIWITAHHTHFTSPGWFFLNNGSGSGLLRGNGSYVSYTSADRKHLTIVIETMDPATSPCFYYMPQYTVAEKQVAQFVLGESYVGIKQLDVWYSSLKFDGSNSTLFNKLQPMQVVNSTLTITLNINEVYTLTTVVSQVPVAPTWVPKSENFPNTYHDNFEGYPEHSEAFNLVQQAGVWEVVKAIDSSHGNVIQQMVLEPPVDTCRPLPMLWPTAIIGNYNWSDITVKVDFFINSPAEFGTSGVFLGARVADGSCDLRNSNGIFLWIFQKKGTILLTGVANKTDIYNATETSIQTMTWYTIRLTVQGNVVNAYLNERPLISTIIEKTLVSNGFAAIGTTDFGKAQFDNLILNGKEIRSKMLKPSSGQRSKQVVNL